VNYRRIYIVCFVAVIVFCYNSCVSQNNYSRQIFRNLSLDEKVNQYEEWASEGRLPHHYPSYLSFIARHGIEAVDSMLRVLNDPGSKFPRKDAFFVVELVHAQGFDVSSHSVLKVIRSIAENSSDPRLRQEASEAIRKIAQSQGVSGNCNHSEQ
jgi:hypothetical protein